VLSPSRQAATGYFQRVQTDDRQFNDLYSEMQRFRGRVYAEDGAVQPDDLVDGRHIVPVDEQSWHILSLDSRGRICACLRYFDDGLAGGFDDLWVRHAALAKSGDLGPRFRRAVETEMARARQIRSSFGEVGGWAVAESHRWTLEPLRIILASYALARLRGGLLGVATATFRHSSATILRRIGLSSMVADGVELPPYYDPHYGCDMEVLRFDSRFPNAKYQETVSELTNVLASAPIICAERSKSAFQSVLLRFEIPAPQPALALATV
jgi:hypothetical protein